MTSLRDMYNFVKVQRETIFDWGIFKRALQKEISQLGEHVRRLPQ